MTQNRKKILVIGAGWEQASLIETIRKNNYEIIATHPSLSGESLKSADHFMIKDSRDIIAHIRIAEAHQVDAIITDNCDYSFYTASIVAKKMGLPFAPIESALLSNDKIEQRNRIRDAGLCQPKYRKIRKAEDLEQASQEIGFPIILKPVDSRGTFGVTITETQAELETAFYDAISNSPSRTLICEKFILGTLITVDGFCFRTGHRALTVASRKFEKGSKPVTKEIIYPAQLSEELKSKLLKNHENIVEKLGYRYGHSHGEYILTNEEEIYLVECTNRGGGVFTSSVIVPLLTGIDLNQLLLNQSLGIDSYDISEISEPFMKKSVMLTFLDFEVGYVIKNINIDEMINLPYTVRYRSIYGENDMIESIENCASRHSMLVIQGETSEIVLKNFDQFKNKLKVEYYK